MRSLFTLNKDSKVEIDPHALTLIPYAKLWNRDKSKSKQKALNDLSYVYFMCDYKSYFADITDEKLKHEEICKVVFEKDNVIIDTEIQKAIEFYKKDVPISVHILEDAKIGVNALREYFKEVDLLKLDENDKPVHDSAKLSNNLQKLASIIDTLEKLEQKVKKDIDMNLTVRGGREKGVFED